MVEKGEAAERTLKLLDASAKNGEDLDYNLLVGEVLTILDELNNQLLERSMKDAGN